MSAQRHAVVVGGGIAGLSVAWGLARGGDRRVTLLERETHTGAHSSARNAQIWLPVDGDETTGPLARRSEATLTALVGSERGWLVRSGAIVLAPDDTVAREVTEGGARGGVAVRAMSRAELHERAPVVEGASLDAPSLFVEGAGIFDPHAMMTALLSACRRAGVNVRTVATVERVTVEAGAVRGVALFGGEMIAADEVVIAAGAWAGRLGAEAGAWVPLVPLRRHLIVLEADPRRVGPMVWRFGEEQVYWRPESGGVLASPCDETPLDACLPAADPAALEALAEVLGSIAPALVDAPVRTKWACLRTYAHDRELVLGPDPRVPGLAWLAGLGGRGMTVGVAAGELCAAAMTGERMGSDDRALLALARPDRSQPAVLAPPA
jgi:glycine/D-amino acid oxidase-like deaminating enzyme